MFVCETPSTSTMSGFSYNKWDNIELSDDESDLHPNIDKESWFRMKHRSRIEREENEDAEVKKIAELTKDDTARLNIIQKQLARIKAGEADDDAADDLEALDGEGAELSAVIAMRNKRVADIKERRSWNMENICSVKESKTIVNSHETKSLAASDFVPTGETEKRLEENKASKAAEDAAAPAAKATSSTTAAMSATAVVPKAKVEVAAGPLESHDVPGARENFSVMSYNDFVLKHEDLLEKYSVLTDMDQSKKCLFQNCDILLHEHAQNYMLLSCLEDEMNSKRARCDKVCRQSQILSHIQELGVSMKRDPRDVVLPLFARLEEKKHFEAFIEQVGEFKKRIYARAVDKRKEMDTERQMEEEEAAPLGPGGLNPFAVLRSLPQTLQDAFESQDMERLQQVLGEMDPKEAKKCMKKCVDSGLWVASDPSVLDGEEEEDDEDEKDEVAAQRNDEEID